MQDIARFYPHTTVAAVVEQDGRFLVVEEQSADGAVVINQPAGHLEDGESLVEAAVRETLEETRCEIEVNGVVGIYRWIHPDGHTYLRFTFSGTLLQEHPGRELDPAILRPLWLSLEELQSAHTPRSPLVLSSIRDFRKRQPYPLELLSDIEVEQ